ncbi:luciferase domain-containing protein [Spirosoma areae]
MKLNQKGPIKPPPVLTGPGQKTAEAIQSWPAIISATHWDLFNRSRVDGADFYVNDAELGHIHLNGEVHLAATNGLGVALLQRGMASPLPYGKAHGDWVSFLIRTDSDADHAVWLFRLNYDRLQGVSMAALTERIAVGLNPVSSTTL